MPAHAAITGRVVEEFKAQALALPIKATESKPVRRVLNVDFVCRFIVVSFIRLYSFLSSSTPATNLAASAR